MAELGQSLLLQALGWATLNSFWQMALLWCLFVIASRLLNLQASRRYNLAAGCMVLGLGWFVYSFFLFYHDDPGGFVLLFDSLIAGHGLLNSFLFAASITYLLLLTIPVYRLFNNWQFVQRIRKDGQSKASFEHRLFVQKISACIGIKKKVVLVVSNMVSSPVTVGFLKPLVLLPAAAFTQLTPSQVEAVLLHELSHIRRNDYLVNLLLTLVNTILYFNPFARLFMNVIEAEREVCCDDLVLRFGYDKVGYATALLQLEKTAQVQRSLVLAAAGKNHLLNRIEKIVGMEKKKPFRLLQAAPLLLAFVTVMLFNSVLIIKDSEKGMSMIYTQDAVFTPWQLDHHPSKPKKLQNLPPTVAPKDLALIKKDQKPASDVRVNIFNYIPAENEESSHQHIIPVDFNPIDGNLSPEKKEQVKSAVDATKKLASTIQWKEIEKQLGEVLNTEEKAIARQEYLNELEKVAWQNIEANLKANYENLNWELIDANVKKALAEVKIDSLQTVFASVLRELENTEKSISRPNKCTLLAMPDASISEICEAKKEIRKSLDCLKAARPKKIIRL